VVLLEGWRLSFKVESIGHGIANSINAVRDEVQSAIEDSHEFPYAVRSQ
jgi:hypothetical protein